MTETARDMKSVIKCAPMRRGFSFARLMPRGLFPLARGKVRSDGVETRDLSEMGALPTRHPERS